MRNNIVRLYAAFLLIPAVIGWAEGGKVTVRRAWPPGSYLMTVTNQSEGTTTVNGEKSQSKDSSTQVWKMVVPAADQKDEKKVTLRLAEARTEGEDGGEAYRFDSAGDGEQKGGLDFVFKPLMGAEVVVTLDADDTVVEATGLDKLWKELGEKAQSPAQKGMVTEHKISMGDKFFETNFRRLESIMPKNAVAAGDTWKAGLRMELPMVGEIKARYDCKLASVEKVDDVQVAVIEAASKYSLSNPKTIEVEGATVTLSSIEMDEKATLKVNLKTGLVMSDETTRNVSTLAKTTSEGKDIEIAGKNVTKSKTTFSLGGKESRPAAKETKAADKEAKPAAKPAGTWQEIDMDQAPEKPASQPAGKKPDQSANPAAPGDPQPVGLAGLDIPGGRGGPAGLPPMVGRPDAVAPPWVKEGVRIVYYVASGRVPGDNCYYRDDTGDWQDRYGNRYTKEGSTGGNGLSQLDILSVDGPAVVTSIRGWSFANGVGPLYPLGTNGYVFLPGQSEWWMNPAALRELPTNPLGELQILRGPYKILKTGKVFENTVVIRSEKPDSRIQHVYDAHTGMLLHMDSNVLDRQGSRGVGRIDFVSMRSVRLPWMGTKPPGWFSTLSELGYQGTRTLQAPGIPASPMPVMSRVKVLRKGDNWALLNLHVNTQLPGGMNDANQVQIVSGPNQVGGFWISPDVLRQLRAQQVLDQDETTGARLAVEQIGNGMAVINETGPAHSYSFGYDLETGILSAETTINQQTHTRVDIRRM